MLASPGGRRLTSVKPARVERPKMGRLFNEESIMAQSTGRMFAQRSDPNIDPIATWPSALAQSCLQMQQLQWEALTAWQQSFATFSKDFWEQWACRYAGGVPIDA